MSGDSINYTFNDSENNNFYYERKLDKIEKAYNYKLHNHKSYEIYIFLEGSVHYFIEGSLYKLDPYDVLVIRDNEMHEAVHIKKNEYNRIVIHVSKDFFEMNNCKEYEKIFTDRELGKGNLISAQYVKTSGIIDTIKRLESYTNEAVNPIPIANSILMELLHVLNKSKFENSTDTMKNDTLKKIIEYINENIENITSLEEIADYLFISKCHLCRIFKKTTGITVNRYITTKRIMLVRQLCQSGKTISAACLEAGFGSYSNFYKIYTKDTGMSPKEGLSKFVEQGKNNDAQLKG